MIIEDLETDIFLHDELKACLEFLKTRNYKFVSGYNYHKPKSDSTYYKLFFSNGESVIMVTYYTWFAKINIMCKCGKPELHLIPKEILETLNSIHKVA